MPFSNVTLNPKDRLLKKTVIFNNFLITGWVFLLMSADLKGEIYHWIHWLITAAILPFIFCQYILERKKILFNFYTCSGYLLIVAILLNTFTAANKIYNLEEALKLFLIFSGYFILVYNYSFLKAAMRGLVLSAVVNFSLLAAGALGNIIYLAHIRDIQNFRWSTILNWPGSLEKVGMAIFCYALYLMLINKRFFLHWFFSFVSLSLVLFDGSRTALFGVYLGYVLIPVFIISNGKYKINRRFILNFCIAVCTFLLATYVNHVVTKYYINLNKNLIGVSLSDNYKGTSHPGDDNRLNQLLYNLRFGLQGLKASDPIRYKMVQTSLEHIYKNPIFGTGLATTTLPVLNPEDRELINMDIHNSYLQVWGNLGLLGFIAFLIIILGWLYYLPYVLKYIPQLDSDIKMALSYNSIFILLFCAISSLTCPLSTEWSEWIMYLIANAFFIRLIKKKFI